MEPLTFGDTEHIQLPLSGVYKGLSPYTALDRGYIGFVYMVSILHKNKLAPDVYIGSKMFDKACKWITYCTSSKLVEPLIKRQQKYGGPTITYHILGYAINKAQLHAIETSYIIKAVEQLGKCRVYNRATASGELLSKASTFARHAKKHKSNTRYT